LFNLVAVYGLNRLVGNLGKEGGINFNPQFPGSSIVDSSNVSTFSQWLKISEEMNRGGVQVALVRGINPVYSMPKSTGFASAFSNVPFIVSFSSFLDETALYADLILPEHVSLEDWGDDVPDPAPGFETLGFQQPVVMPFKDTRGFGDLLLTIAGELGGPVSASLPWDSFRDVLRSGVKEIYELNRGSLKAATYEEFWVGILQRGGWWDMNSKKVDVGPPPGPIPVPEAPEFFGDPSTYPMHLIPFPAQAIGDGSGAHLPWLQATPDPITTATWRTWVEVNPKDGKELALREGDVVRVESPSGSIEAQVYIHPATPPGIISIPMGQGHTQYGRYAAGRGANLTDILVPQQDKSTGALAWAATRIRLVKTGGRDRIPKAEGMTVAVPVMGFPVVRITNH
jgi:anaerobic selenocysteine-containing dehydrogenase